MNLFRKPSNDPVADLSRAELHQLLVKAFSSYKTSCQLYEAADESDYLSIGSNEFNKKIHFKRMMIALTYLVDSEGVYYSDILDTQFNLDICEYTNTKTLRIQRG